MENGLSQYFIYLDAITAADISKRQVKVAQVIYKYIMRYNQFIHGAALSREVIAKEAGLSKRNVTSTIQELVELNMITVDKYSPGDKNTYRIKNNGEDAPRKRKTMYYHRNIESWTI